MLFSYALYLALSTTLDTHLTTLLGDDDFATREAASARLATRAYQAQPILWRAFSSSDPEVRRRADLILHDLRQAQLETASRGQEWPAIVWMWTLDIDNPPLSLVDEFLLAQLHPYLQRRTGGYYDGWTLENHQLATLDLARDLLDAGLPAGVVRHFLDRARRRAAVQGTQLPWRSWRP